MCGNKCIKQLALNAVKNVKFHSNQTQTSPFIVVSVGQRSGQQDQDDIKLTA